MTQRQAVTKKKALTYRDADRATKSRILDELVDLTGWHRDHARAALRDALTLKIVKPRTGRTATYGDDLLPALVKCWAVLRSPAGKILAPGDPASPWQRGSNENTNGLLRPYFPKGSDLSNHGPEELERVAHLLNSRPRATLGWDTPSERIRELIHATKSPTVALTT